MRTSQRPSYLGRTGLRCCRPCGSGGRPGRSKSRKWRGSICTPCRQGPARCIVPATCLTCRFLSLRSLQLRLFPHHCVSLNLQTPTVWIRQLEFVMPTVILNCCAMYRNGLAGPLLSAPLSATLFFSKALHGVRRGLGGTSRPLAL